MAFALACFAEAEAITVRLADDGRALLNPDMGLTMHYYANGPYYGNTLEPGDALDWFPGCSVVYLRLPWADLEPDEGAFNWSAVDTPAQQWLARGGQVAFRVTVSETSARATPEWVRAAGARTINWEYKGRSLWDPVPDDPIFLDKFGNFLRAFAARYDGRREVAFVDIGSVGIWGEGHTFRSIKLSREETQRIVRLHIDLHKRHFKKTRLIANDDFTGSNTTDDSESIDYAQANGLGWRDDSIMVDSRPWFHAQQAARFWTSAPVVLEFGHYAHCRRTGHWNAQTLLNAVETHHASYLSIHGDPKTILQENSSLLARVNRRIGYRLVPLEVSWPEKVTAGEGAQPFVVSSRWKNAGVAPCLNDAFPCLTAKDTNGKIVGVFADGAFNLKSLGVGTEDACPSAAHSAEFTFGRWQRPCVKTGTYDLYVSLGQCDGTPVYELPLAHSDGQRRYRIGRITFENPPEQKKGQP